MFARRFQDRPLLRVEDFRFARDPDRKRRIRFDKSDFAASNFARREELSPRPARLMK
jgi:hypothetical protein